MTADQQQPYSVQQQPPPSASERAHKHDSSCVDRDDNVLDDLPAPSTGATAGEEGDLEAIRAEWSGFDPAGDPAVQQVHWLIAELDSLRAEVAQLRSDLAERKQTIESLLTGMESYALEIRDLELQATTLRSDLGLALSERDTYRERCDRMAEVIKTLDSDIAHAQAELEEARFGRENAELMWEAHAKTQRELRAQLIAATKQGEHWYRLWAERGADLDQAQQQQEVRD